ncbi:MAG: NAD(P)(+) transhydrogenase (Re/Si-specific) subunit beta [Desulfobacteraceae bacterium]|nr:NAD(P)(+) transhydrogenase (Re/Si-specific) subunit beta [Desulfobacteraceae bacterium]
MSQILHLLLDLAVIAILLVGIHRFNSPVSARLGNHLASLALALGVVLALWRAGSQHPLLLAVAALAGAAVGWRLAMRVTMVQIPAMVAFQHGAGGLAAALVAYVELSVLGQGSLGVARLSGLAGLLVGAATFSGSLIAAAKLSGRMRPTPLILPRHGAATAAVLIVSLVAGAWALSLAPGPVLVLAALLAVAGGALFAVRIGGADMPVLISFLNATAGLAAAACGIILQDRLLIAFGATVAASGSILTRVMCHAMNRRMAKVFAGHQGEVNWRPFDMFHKPGAAAAVPLPPAAAAPTAEPATDPFPAALEAMGQARRIVIIPGYGMALARAQFNVASLAARLTALGKSVKFAIHPVAGRMPGHMHVLLAEADVDYDLLHEMDAINPEMGDTDVVLVVGACDVVNPAAVQTGGTPISGMPILEAHLARTVIVCNLDRKPGYSGVDNLLYGDPKTILLLGDAQGTTAVLLEAFSD